MRPSCQSREQEPSEREALHDEAEPLDEQNRSDHELEHGDALARRKEQMDIEDHERECGEPTQPGQVHGCDQCVARDRRGWPRVERQGWSGAILTLCLPPEAEQDGSSTEPDRAPSRAGNQVGDQRHTATVAAGTLVAAQAAKSGAAVNQGSSDLSPRPSRDRRRDPHERHRFGLTGNTRRLSVSSVLSTANHKKEIPVHKRMLLTALSLVALPACLLRKGPKR